MTEKGDEEMRYSEDEMNRFIIPYNKSLQKEHPILWKLNYIGLGFVYNFLRKIK